MTFLPDCDAIEPFGEAQRKLLPWLSQDDDEGTGLMERLEGLHLPAAGLADEPYVWILRGLPRGGQSHPARDVLASRLRTVLARRPDVERPGKRPDQVLHNLLMLAASLGDPDKLAEPLFEMLHRKQVQGEWVGLDLRSALLAALVYNQPDNRLRKTWDDMLGRKATGYLAGGPYDGFQGALLMPADAGSRGKPTLGLMGSALRQMADYLTEVHPDDRRPRFRTLLRRLQETYPSPNDWNAKLVRIADEYEWPKWAVLTLPGLPPPVSKTRQKPCEGVLQGVSPMLVAAHEALSTRHVWKDVHRFVPNARVIGKVCAGEIIEIEVRSDEEAFLDLLSPELEESLSTNPFSSDASTDGAANQAMMKVGQRLAREDRHASADFELQRRAFLTERNLLSPDRAAATR